MFAQERQQKILAALKKRSRLHLPELVQMLQASPATVRRDLNFLESTRQVVRTHGGVLLSPEGDEAQGRPLDRKSRREHHLSLALARQAADLVRGGESVFVDSGQAPLEVGRRLLQREGLTVFTNSVALLNEEPAAGCRLIALGGELRVPSRAVVGAGALDWMRRLHFDLAFIGASGVDAGKGPGTTDLADAAVKTAAIGAARRSVLLVDAIRWRQPAPIRFAEWSEIDDIVTDHDPTAEETALLASNGVTLHRAG